MTYANTIEESVKACGFELYDVCRSHKSDLIQITIFHQDRPITLDDCVDVHKQLLYAGLECPLEVSSPGSERKLKKAQHFLWSLNQIIQVTTHEQSIQGKLLSADETSITVAHDHEQNTIPLASITKAFVIPHQEAD